MPYTYEELKGKTIAELREIAKEQTDEAVQGYTQMNKDHLLPALCKALGIDARAHHVAHGEVKIKARARMKALRAERQKVVGTHARCQSAQGHPARIPSPESPPARECAVA